VSNLPAFKKETLDKALNTFYFHRVFVSFIIKGNASMDKEG